MKQHLLKNSFLRGVLFLLLCVVGLGNAWGEKVTFKLHTGEVTDGYYIIVSNGVAMNNQTSSNRLQYDNVTISNNIIQAESNARYVWYITSEENNTYTIKNAKDSYYAVSTETKNQATTKNGPIDDKYKWHITNNETKCSIENVYNKANNINYTIRRNSTYGFACYAASTGTGPILYKKIEAPTKTVTELTISGNASKTAYYVGDTPSTEGLVVKATYDDKTISDVTDDVIWTFNPEKLTEEGNIEVTATAEYQNKSVSHTYNVIVTKNPKITDYTKLEDGKKYYIVATKDNNDYFFNTPYTETKDIRNTGSTNKNNATIVTAIAHESSNNKWAFQFSNGKYLSLPTTDKNGYISIVNTSEYWNLANNTNKQLIKMWISTKDENYYLQINVQTNNYFGSYKNTQTDIWFLEVPTCDVEISSAGLATFCLPYNATIPNGLTAYTATDNGESVKLTAKEGGKIAAGEGVVLKGDEGTYTFVAAEGSVSATAGNQMVGVTEDTELTEADNAYMLTRKIDDSSIAFRLLKTNYTLEANRAYLKVDGSANTRELIPALWDDNATGIYDLSEKEEAENGAIYNLAGQKLMHTQKGINIINGKLVIK